MRKYLLLACALTGCGGDDGGSGTADAPSAPPMVMISGAASTRTPTSSMRQGGVYVEALRTSDDVAVANATSDANGAYAIVLDTGGVALSGYLKGSYTGYLDTYLYPPGLIDKDFDNAEVNLLTQQTLDLAANTFCGANQLTTNGMIAVLVVEPDFTPVAGAVVASAPAASKVCYNSGGFPNRMATSTDTDGIAYMFNVTGPATVSATKAGLTFRTTVLKARAGAFTTALVQP